MSDKREEEVDAQSCEPPVLTRQVAGDIYGMELEEQYQACCDELMLELDEEDEDDDIVEFFKRIEPAYDPFVDSYMDHKLLYEEDDSFEHEDLPDSDDDDDDDVVE